MVGHVGSGFRVQGSGCKVVPETVFLFSNIQSFVVYGDFFSPDSTETSGGILFKIAYAVLISNLNGCDLKKIQRIAGLASK
jgi:hypothetical protein